MTRMTEFRLRVERFLAKSGKSRRIRHLARLIAMPKLQMPRVETIVFEPRTHVYYFTVAVTSEQLHSQQVFYFDPHYEQVKNELRLYGARYGASSMNVFPPGGANR